jgi:hypothetical protein
VEGSGDSAERPGRAAAACVLAPAVRLHPRPLTPSPGGRSKPLAGSVTGGGGGVSRRPGGGLCRPPASYNHLTPEDGAGSPVTRNTSITDTDGSAPCPRRAFPDEHRDPVRGTQPARPRRLCETALRPKLAGVDGRRRRGIPVRRPSLSSSSGWPALHRAQLERCKCTGLIVRVVRKPIPPYNPPLMRPV